MVCYYEWLQNKRSERWDLEEVESKLEKRMKRTYAQVRDFAHERKLDYPHRRLRDRPRAHRAGLLRARHLPVADR